MWHFFYMMPSYLSLVTGENDEINFGIKNRHPIDITTLYILLVFAPPSIFEIAVQKYSAKYLEDRNGKW